jgi:hypothetical protein
MSAVGGLPVPVVNSAFEPASVRNGSAATKQAYATALQFESLLVNQLAQQLSSSAGFMGQDGSSDSSGDDSSGDDSSSSDPASSELSALLPQALTSSIMAGGGIGIAAGMMASIAPATTTKART